MEQTTSPRLDQCQVFKVKHARGNILRVHVIRGEGICQQWIAQAVDVPDQYVVLHIPNTPNGRKKTKTIDNSNNPVWDEVFTFYINPNEDKLLYVSLKDSNYLKDTLYGEVTVQLDELVIGQEVNKVLTFPNSATVHMTLLQQEDDSPDLRFSVALCSQEEEFIKLRKKWVLKALRNLLGEEKGPKTEDQVPHIGIIASGGGFRAMTGLSGAMKALHHLGFLDCAMFIASLSGSSWYVSSLYSEGMYPAKFQELLKGRVTKDKMHEISSSYLCSYASSICEKSKNGQPVCLTDFFGHAVGDTLLPEKKNTKLSDQVSRINKGQLPLPLYAGLHVKRDVSERAYHNWIEFSPYEIGILKYGTFMSPKLFNNKFYMGRVMTKYEEPPIHYLQGVWGSAYSICLRRIFDTSRADIVQVYNTSDVKNMTKGEEDITDHHKKCITGEAHDEEDIPTSDEENEAEDQLGGLSVISSLTENYWKRRKNEHNLKKEEKKKSFLDSMVDSLFTIIDSRAARASQIFNPLRGLDILPISSPPPFTPTTPNDDVDFKGNFEPMDTSQKKMYIVDSGLAFNIPFPLLLRQQREVQLYLSFDFTCREKDDSPVFGELLSAEKWARINSVSFPPVDKQVQEYIKKPLQECYVFEDKDDPYCPVIVHFILINKEFRKYKDVGVEREEEDDFGNFDIFSDPADPYNSFNMTYTDEQFDRLVKLMEFNTKLNADLIKQQISVAVLRKQILKKKNQ